MKSRKRNENKLRALCAQVFSDDGVDPRNDKPRDSCGYAKIDARTWRLCKQVERAMHLALGEVLGVDDAEARVTRVTPAPFACRLQVTVAVMNAAAQERVATLLNTRGGRLRAEAAAAITRRRAPDLIFEVIVEEAAHE